ncbi:hypothetical protein [Leuconostoc suionicum]|uniref:hypothetical protein n=1 Tax=Leuconostoc suionicum TaxID=1511761 RepID=UPI0032DFF754
MNEYASRKAKRAYQLFHDKCLAIKDEIKDFDEAKLMVRTGNYNSLDIFGNYTEHIDSYNELLALLKNDYVPAKSHDKGA